MKKIFVPLFSILIIGIMVSQVFMQEKAIEVRGSSDEILEKSLETFERTTNERPRARDIGIEIGIFALGKWNAITDVKGVKIGHVTVDDGKEIHTGCTAILPHGGNLFTYKVPAAVYCANAYGKARGFNQIEELGNIETPILLTQTLNVPRVADALIQYMLVQNPTCRSVNPVVGETNGFGDTRCLHVNREHVFQAINSATSGPVEEGSVGAGRGTRQFGWKGGIGTSSRVLPPELGGYTVGVLVQTNYGGILRINGAPVGRELDKFSFSEYTHSPENEGSCMIIVATDAPLSPRNLKRLCKRAMYGLIRTGSFSSDGSGDYVIAFSTQNIISEDEAVRKIDDLDNSQTSPLFLAVVEATEEAAINALLKATTVVNEETGEVYAEAIDIQSVISICEKYCVLNYHTELPPWSRSKK